MTSEFLMLKRKRKLRRQEEDLVVEDEDVSDIDEFDYEEEE